MLSASGPFSYIDTGRMFSIFKVRDELASYDGDPGWYRHPPATVGSLLASPDEMRRDGIAPGETAELIWKFGSTPQMMQYGCHVPGHYAAKMIGTIQAQ